MKVFALCLTALVCGSCANTNRAAATDNHQPAVIRQTTFNDQGWAVGRIVLNGDARVRDIARRLVFAAGEPVWSHDLWVFVWHNELDERQMRPIAALVRAFGTLPHRIIIHREIARVATDDELAFLIAHELGHAALRDNDWQMRRALRLQYGVEQYADAFGVTLTRAAGFDSSAAVESYCEFLTALEQAERRAELFVPDGAHPPAVQRCSELRQLARNPI